MSRSRNIKPGFFKNDLLAECNPLARILFAGLWCEADREGRLEDRPKRLKAEYLAYDECDIDELLNQLAARGFIVRYVIEGANYITVPEFLKHQNPHCKEQASRIPAPEKHGASTVHEPCINSSSTELAGLIPSSLIPSSLIQETQSAIADSSPESAALDSADPGDAFELEQEGGDEPPGAPRCPVKQIIAAYHELLPQCPPSREFPEQSVKCLRARWRSDPDRQTVTWWRGFFAYVARCPFLVGEKTDFQADLTWLVRPTNFAKVINGNYQERTA